MGFPLTSVIDGVLNLGGKVFDHFFPPKISEKELYEIVATETVAERRDAAHARLLAMVEARTQQKPWIVRLINGLWRPVIGAYLVFIGSLCLKPSRWFWSQMFGWEIPEFDLSREEWYFIGSLNISVINFYFGLITYEKFKGVRAKQ